eukprot:2417351-Rhodomonas_salina.3
MTLHGAWYCDAVAVYAMRGTEMAYVLQGCPTSYKAFSPEGEECVRGAGHAPLCAAPAPVYVGNAANDAGSAADYRSSAAVYGGSDAVYRSSAAVYGGTAVVYGGSAAVYRSSAAVYGGDARVSNLGGAGADIAHHSPRLLGDARY